MLAFAYKGTNRSDEKTSGVVLANTQLEANRFIAQMGIKRSNCYYDPVATLSWRLSPHYPKNELSLFFRIVGENLAGGADIQTAFRSSRLFINNPFLRSACEKTLIYLDAGSSLDDAMEKSQFHKTDTIIVRSLRNSDGGYAQAFSTRARSLAFEGETETAINGVLRPFYFAVIFSVVMFWVVLFAVGDQLVKSVTNLVADQSKIEGFLAFYIKALQLLHAHQLLFSVLYFAGIGSFLWLLASKYKDAVLAKVFKSYERFREYLDQYRTWQLWKLLKDMRVDNARIFDIAEIAVSHPKIVQQNATIAKHIRAGRSLAEAIKTQVSPLELREQLTSVFMGAAEDKSIETFVNLLETQIGFLQQRTVAVLNALTRVTIGVAFLVILMMLIVPQFLIAKNAF